MYISLRGHAAVRTFDLKSPQCISGKFDCFTGFFNQTEFQQKKNKIKIRCFKMKSAQSARKYNELNIDEMKS